MGGSMKTIMEYELVGSFQTLHMPQGAKIIHVDSGDGLNILLWVEANPQQQVMEARKFRYYGNGQAIEPVEGKTLNHIGTLLQGYRLPIHVYEEVGIKRHFNSPRG